MISFFRASACVPNTACTLLPTSDHAGGAESLSRAWSTFFGSATSIRSRVIQASTLTRFSRPPNAAMSCSAFAVRQRPGGGRDPCRSGGDRRRGVRNPR